MASLATQVAGKAASGAAARLVALRALMSSAVSKGLAAYVVPSADAHQSEYVTPHDERRAFLTGFTGSAGTAVVTPSSALLWTDGRYHLQASQQLSEDWSLMKAGLKDVLTVEEWLAKHLSSGDTVGIDPYLSSVRSVERLKAKLLPKGISIEPVTPNLVDAIWEDQPALPQTLVRVHPAKYAGKASADKLSELREAMKEAGATAVVVGALDDIAWLLNIRGSDIPCNPVSIAYVLVDAKETHLCIDPAKLDDAARAHLETVATLHPYTAMADLVKAAGAGDGAKVWLDPTSCNHAIYMQVPKDKILQKDTPIALAKALKNDVEIEGFRQANIRDGAALVNFFAWLEDQLAKPAGDRDMELTEYTISERLALFRADQEGFVYPSFDTIAGSGSNGAIIHYKPEKETAAPVVSDKLLLVDSGGQYVDGTTDTTRTVHFGSPSDYEKRCFTRVLQGHIALATAVFPDRTQGYVLDAFARAPLWRDGKVYRHGTGHGVGAYLNVHEGPHGISSWQRPYKGGFRPRMTTSNEPGYYEDGNFGIRIESVHVSQACAEDGPMAGFLTFENLTPVPIQTKLVDTALLSAEELQWLNDYNAWTREKLTPLLTGPALEYLNRETQSVAAAASSTSGGAGAGAGAGAKA